MLIEDDPDISAIAVLSLQLDPKLVVITANSGRAALDRLRRAPTPDLILLDNHLPDIEGVALTRAINAGRSQPIAIAFLTASVRACDRERYENAGAIGVLAKPFEPTALALEVRRLLATS
nr:response regulator [Sphingomonas yunnanensis]